MRTNRRTELIHHHERRDVILSISHHTSLFERDTARCTCSTTRMASNMTMNIRNGDIAARSDVGSIPSWGSDNILGEEE